MKKMKRVLVLCLVAAMCMGMLVLPAHAADKSQAEAFVQQLYSGLLDRSADDAGLTLYTNMILNQNTAGARIAELICSSGEFRDRALNNEEYVKALYKGLLDRDADASGLATYKGELDSGKSRSLVLQQLVSSLEFTAICLKYGLFVGTISASTTTNVNQTSVNSTLARDYVARLYRYLLGEGRETDTASIDFWTQKLAKREMSAAGVAASIAASDEFKNKSLTDGDYVSAIYWALLGRQVDGNGWRTWLTALSNGRSRTWVFSSICASAEFKNQFGEMNVTAGSVSTSSTTISGNNVNTSACEAYITRLYRTILGHDPDTEGLIHWRNILVNRQMSAAGVAASIASSAEARSLDRTRSDFVNVVYQALLNRAPDTEGEVVYTAALKNGYSRSWVFTKICASSEFQNRSEFGDMNVVPGYLSYSAYNMG